MMTRKKRSRRKTRRLRVLRKKLKMRYVKFSP